MGRAWSGVVRRGKSGIAGGHHCHGGLGVRGWGRGVTMRLRNQAGLGEGFIATGGWGFGVGVVGRRCACGIRPAAVREDFCRSCHRIHTTPTPNGVALREWPKAVRKSGSPEKPCLRAPDPLNNWHTQLACISPAPTGRSMVAQGNALGLGHETKRALKGRPSIEDVVRTPIAVLIVFGRPFRARIINSPKPRALPWATIERPVGAHEVATNIPGNPDLCTVRTPSTCMSMSLTFGLPDFRTALAFDGFLTQRHCPNPG